MTAVAREAFGREYDYAKQSSGTRRYYIDEAETEDDAVNAVIASAPPRIGQVFIDNVSVNEIGDGKWTGEASYEPFGNKSPEESNWPTPQYTFDTQGGQQHLSNSYETISAHAIEGHEATVDDYGGAINVSKDKEVQGVDVPLANYTWTEKWTFLPSKVTEFYLKNLFLLSTCVNKYSFRTFAEGEVIFLGAAGSQTEPDRCEITFKFSALPNMTNIKIGDITIPFKRGWDYMWVVYQKEENQALKQIVSKPKAAYIEQIYQYASFTSLQIGF